jgi:aspartate/methionine/tyrosine aminotransferase
MAGAQSNAAEAAGVADDTAAGDVAVARVTSHEPAVEQRAPLALGAAAQSLRLSPTLAINEAIASRRAAGHEVIHLGFGEASFPLHPHLREALVRGATSTSYAPVLGIPALRAALAGHLTRTRGLAVEADSIVVAPGSKPLLYVLMLALDGDAMIPVPSWVSYAPQARLAGKQVIPVATDPTDHHTLTPAALAEALTRGRRQGADPRIVIVNTPSNPTGSMFAPETAQALANWARAAGVTIVCDEIYAELAHGWRPHVSPARFYPEGAVVTGGLSKAFSAGGWRLGYAAVPATPEGRRAIQAVRALGSEMWSAASGPIQEAGAVAYAPDADIEAYVRRSARVHGHVTGRLHQTLTALGIPCPRPAGAFYLYPDFAPWRRTLAARGIASGDALALHLLEEWGIATLPATAFGEEPGALRLRLATSMLYAGGDGHAHESALWELLRQADALPEDDPAAGEPLPLPGLERAERRFAEIIASLGAPEMSEGA